ncbi:hypothetical protein [Kaistia terrae]|uniref:Uncharacterized protein n=1 Tax=Kaistia terrae TaxID=537017 RepID=A0ABW0Q8Z1_9HYPH|nr:hypothetical protein [Kaistia terrae]MCX5581319.1 hypothetical protein [Kaistia terrae]
MRSLDPAELAAIVARTVVARDLVVITVKDRITGNSSDVGFWSDAGSLSCLVKNGRTGVVETKSFVGGALVSIGDIPLISDISVRTVDVVLSGIDASVIDATRTYDARNAPIAIYRGYLNPDTLELVAPAKSRFVGFIDEAPVVTPSEGGASTVTLSCASHTRELTRKNPDVRSHESQILRKSDDDFYHDTSVVETWEIFWGKEKGRAG